MGAEVDEGDQVAAVLVDQEKVPADVALSGTIPVALKLVIQVLGRNRVAQKKQRHNLTGRVHITATSSVIALPGFFEFSGIVAVERYASSDLLYELKAARDKLNSSSHNGLFLALFGTDPLVLR